MSGPSLDLMVLSEPRLRLPNDVITVCLSSVSVVSSSSFDFCAVEAEKRPSENLGQVLFGERIEPSPYKVPRGGWGHGCQGRGSQEGDSVGGGGRPPEGPPA